MFRSIVAHIVLAGVLAFAAGTASCKDSASAKAGLAGANSVVNMAADSPACDWVSAVAHDPGAGTICRDVLELLGGGLAIASHFAAHGPTGPVAYKEVRAAAGGRLLGVLRPDVASELVKRLADKGVTAAVAP